MIMSSFVRWGGIILVTTLFTWFGGNAVKSTYSKAALYEQEKEGRVADQAVFDQKILDEKLAREEAENNAIKNDERREHWRQSYYKLNGQFDKYQEATKDWIGDSYPAELDGLRREGQVYSDPARASGDLPE